MNLFADVEKVFSSCSNAKQIYKKIIELGRSLPALPESLQTEKNLVIGCQSTVYLHSEYREGKMFFLGCSDALISAGLIALLIKAYSGQSAKFILTNKPIFLEKIDILSSLSPGRANGLASMYLRMQKDVLKFLK